MMPQHQTAICAVLRDILRFEQTADALLADYFRQHKNWGKNDRHTISQTVYDVLRRWQAIENRVPNARDNLEQVLAVLPHLPPISDAVLPLHNALDKASGSLNEAAELPQHWLERLRQDGIDDDTIYLIGHSQAQAAQLDLRVNLLKNKRQAVLKQLRDEGHDARETPFSAWGIRLNHKPALQNHTLFQNGSIEIQDEGSQLLALLTGARRNEIVVDFCAGAGGKTLALAAMMQNTGRLYAFDINEKRLAKLKERAERAGVKNLNIQRLNRTDDAKLQRLYRKADRVLVDAPCTGMGTLRRHPDLKYRQTPAELDKLLVLQHDILQSAAQLVRPDGHLLYATCSLLPQENQRQIERFLVVNHEFHLLNIEDFLPKSWASGGLLPSGSPFLQLWPHQHHTDGFFAAILQRRT